MDAEADISRKEQLQRNMRACAELRRRLSLFHPEHAPAQLRKMSKSSAVVRAPVGPRGTIEATLRAVAAHYGVTTTDITARGRRAAVAEARQVAIFLARQLTSLSLAQIAKPFGRRDHTTILHAVRKTERRRQRDPEFGRVLDAIAAQIRSRRRRAA